jgi:hypothetical protein
VGNVFNVSGTLSGSDVENKNWSMVVNFAGTAQAKTYQLTDLQQVHSTIGATLAGSSDHWTINYTGGAPKGAQALTLTLADAAATHGSVDATLDGEGGGTGQITVHLTF